MTSCGPACLAIVTGMSYEKALCVAFPEHATHYSNRPTLPFYGIYPDHLILALRSVCKKANMLKSVNNWSDVRKSKKDLILVIKWPKAEGGETHCVVWSAKEKRVLDPGLALSKRIRHYPESDYRDAFHRGSRYAIAVETV